MYVLVANNINNLLGTFIFNHMLVRHIFFLNLSTSLLLESIQTINKFIFYHIIKILKTFDDDPLYCALLNCNYISTHFQ